MLTLHPFASTDVRVRYQNQNMPLPMCAAPGKHLPGAPEFCTLAAFRERVKALTPTDWERECTPLSAGAMSKQAEREEAYEAAVKVVGPP